MFIKCIQNDIKQINTILPKIILNFIIKAGQCLFFCDGSIFPLYLIGQNKLTAASEKNKCN